MDLFAQRTLVAYNPAVVKRTFRQRIGDRLLLEREQVKHWSRRKAAMETGVNDGTIRAIERGENAGWSYFERYAKALALSLEQVCREVLEVEEGDGRALDADEQRLLETLTVLRDVPEDREAFLRMASAFRLLGKGSALGDPARTQSAPPADQRASDSPESSDADSAPPQRARGRR